LIETVGRQTVALAAPAAAGGVEASECAGPQRALRGVIETTTWAAIEGWVWDPETPDEPIVIELLEGGVQQATAVAGQHRQDLAQAGIGDGRHGFKIELPPGLLTNERHILDLRCADSGTVVPGSPITLDPPADARQATLRWYLDEITDTGVAGWILDKNDPTRSCAVMLKEGGRTLARTTAARFRADLLSAGIGNGCHAFTLEMPRSLLDGAEHWLDVVEEETGLSLSDKPLRWRSEWGTARSAQIAAAPRHAGAGGGVSELVAPLVPPPRRPALSGKPGTRPAARVNTHLLFDISDLIYFLGHYPNLTGIQRVQSSIVLSVVQGAVADPSAVVFLSFNTRIRRWTAIPTGFLVNLLQDLFLPPAQRLISFSAEEARYGQLPGAREFDGVGVLDDGTPSVLCLLGAAWMQSDYFNRILSFKRRFGTRFVMMVHDLVSIYARETCDQGTARVFEEFLRRALRHVDHYLCVSENTARDLRRYIASLALPSPSITVSRNGSSFDEFLPAPSTLSRTDVENLPDRFVLFVATIEGRKNHQLMLDIWRRMVAQGDDPPHLVCVGRVGWRSERFVADLVESDYLDGKVVLLQEISDAQLKWLYDHALFTVCPSLYEGWGLPVGESLAAGKVCVLSDRASLPEVAGDFGVYIDIDDREQSWRVVRDLIVDDALRQGLEARIRAEYRPITWRQVATAVVGACEAAAIAPWLAPYPYEAVPYGTEISFARLSREADATFGDGLLNRIMDARRGHFLPEPLQELSFLRGEDARAGGLWAEPEAWGTWLCQAGGDLVLALAANESVFYYVFLRLRASGPAANLPVRLLANGEPAWQGRVGDRPRDMMVRVRRRAASAASGWQLKLRAETELSAEARNEIAAVDGRMPSIGFERLVVVPESDLKTRLELLTNLLLSAAA
jgi:glycosyltransferase involved in cell wall biosynthesis